MTNINFIGPSTAHGPLQCYKVGLLCSLGEFGLVAHEAVLCLLQVTADLQSSALGV